MFIRPVGKMKVESECRQKKAFSSPLNVTTYARCGTSLFKFYHAVWWGQCSWCHDNSSTEHMAPKLHWCTVHGELTAQEPCRGNFLCFHCAPWSVQLTEADSRRSSSQSSLHSRGPKTMQTAAYTCSAGVVMLHRAQSHHLLLQLFLMHPRPWLGRSSQGKMQLCRCQLQGCLWPLAEAEAASAGLRTCRRCTLVSPVCHQAKELQEELSRLYSSSDNEKDEKGDWPYLCQDPAATRTWSPDCTKGGAGRVCAYCIGRWRLLVMATARRLWLLAPEEGSFLICSSAATE